MRESRQSGSEGGAGSNIPVPTPIFAALGFRESPLSQQRLGDVSVNVCESAVDAIISDGQLFVIDAE